MKDGNMEMGSGLEGTTQPQGMPSGGDLGSMQIEEDHASNALKSDKRSMSNARHPGRK